MEQTLGYSSVLHTSVILSLICILEPLGKFEEYGCLSLTPRDSELIDLGSFKSSSVSLKYSRCWEPLMQTESWYNSVTRDPPDLTRYAQTCLNPKASKVSLLCSQGRLLNLFFFSVWKLRAHICWLTVHYLFAHDGFSSPPAKCKC